MSVVKFLAGTTLATPAIGGVSYVTYEELTKDTSTKEVSAADSTTTPTGTLTGEVTTPESAGQTGSDGRDVVAQQSSDSISGEGVEQGHSEEVDASSGGPQKSKDSGTDITQTDQPPVLSPSA